MTKEFSRCEKFQTCLYISLVIIFGAMQLVVIPLSAEIYVSIYFLILMVCAQFAVISFFAMLFTNRFRIRIPNEKLTVFLCGLFGALMTIFYVYSADPNRTQPVMQIILMGLRIIPSVVFTKIILEQKKNKYEIKFILPSMLFLLISIGLTMIPLRSSFSIDSIIWIGMFLTSVIFAALYSIYQEKYIADTRDDSTPNKMVLIFWTRLIQLIAIILCFWLEFVIGHKTHHPFNAFMDSCNQFLKISKNFVVLELGIVAYLISYVASTYLLIISVKI